MHRSPWPMLIITNNIQNWYSKLVKEVIDQYFMRLRWGGIFNERFIAYFPEIATVKEFRKLVSIWWSYAWNTVTRLFSGHGVFVCGSFWPLLRPRWCRLLTLHWSPKPTSLLHNVYILLTQPSVEFWKRDTVGYEGGTVQIVAIAVYGPMGILRGRVEEFSETR